MADFIESDHATYYAYCKQVDGTAFDVTNYTPKLRFSINGAAASEKTMTKEDAAAGEVSYRFGDNELVHGEMESEVYLVDGSSKVITCLDPEVHIVRKKIG